MPISELHAAALEYIRDGYPVFPIRPNGKEPLTENGFKDASTDVDQINEWWTAWPDANIAFEPEKLGLCAVDVEAAGLAQLNDFCNGHGALAKTFYNKTPRGGEHLYFKGSLPGKVRPFAGFEIDTRGKGSYVLLPPSRTSDGVYETPDNNFDIAELPQWISARLSERKHDRQIAPDNFELDLPDNIHRARTWLAGFEAPVQGERNHKTFLAACRLKDLGLSPRSILSLLLEWAPLADDFTTEEVEGRVISAFENGQNAPGNDAVTPSTEAFAKIVANAPKVKEERSRFHMADEDEQDAEPAAEWQLDGVLPRRGTLCVYGASGAYKSFLLLDMALGVASGGQAWGVQTRAPGTVIYGALEGRTALSRERRPAWRLAKGIKGKLPFYVTRAPMIGTPGECDEFVAQADKKAKVKPIRLIVFETAAKMLVGCDATRDVPKLIAYCETLAERYDCTVVVSHHAGHDVQKGPKDSSTYHQGFDNVIAVETPSRGSKIAIATITKFKDFPEPEQPFTFEGKPVGKSLVFQRTSADQHRTLTKKEDALAGAKVGGALKRLGAVGLERSVVTGVLAAELFPPTDTETIEDREAALVAATRKLNKLSKTLLEGYCTHQSTTKGGMKWHLP